MTILRNEIKKIFNPINLLIVGLITIIIWLLFMEMNIEYFPNGENAKQQYNLSVYMLENYGTYMDKDEYEDFKNIREEKIKEANEYLSTIDEFVSSGIVTYDEFKKISSDNEIRENEKRLDEISSKIMFEDKVEVFWLLQELDYIIERYEDKESWIGLGGMKESKVQQARHKEIEERENVKSPLNFDILRNYDNLNFGITLIILLSVSILVSPIFINDNKNKVNYLQYSSKIGRNMFNKKAVASILSAIMITTIQLGIFFIVYKSNNTYMFWDCSINSAINDMSSWFDMTFGDYIILSIILNYVVAILTAIISISVGSKVNNYISAIGVQIPILLAFGGILKGFGMFNLTTTYYPKYMLHILYGTMIIVAIFMIIKRKKYEKVMDIQ